jgi:predicted ATPase
VDRWAAGPAGGWLVERDGELEAVDRALAGAVGGEGSLVFVGGPAGIGKTALVRAASERSDRAGVVFLAARGAELEGGFPYWVVRQLLEPTVRAASRSRRGRLLSGAAASSSQAVLGEGGAAADLVDPGFAVLHGLYWLVANIAAESPLVLVVDDAHWVDAPSLRFVTYPKPLVSELVPPGAPTATTWRLDTFAGTVNGCSDPV